MFSCTLAFQSKLVTNPFNVELACFFSPFGPEYLVNHCLFAYILLLFVNFLFCKHWAQS